MEGDPFSEGSIWSFNYFFIDRDCRKIAYFTCVACTNIQLHQNNNCNNLDSDLNNDNDNGEGDYQTTSDADSEYYGGVRSGGDSYPNSPDPYGSPIYAYGSPRVTSTASDMEEEYGYDGRQEQYKDGRGDVAMQAADDSDESFDEMM